MCLATEAFGQQADPPEDIITDRPDFTESAVVVPRGHIQIESGLTWVDDVGHVTVFTVPEMLIRWTLVERLELRFVVPNFISTRNGSTESGFGDSFVGTKVQFGPVADWDLAGIVTLSLPTGREPFTRDQVDPGIVVTAGRDLGDTWSFGSQLSADWISLTDDRSFFWGGTAVLGKSLGGLWTTFVEMSFTVPERETTLVSIHAGATYLLKPNLQLDAHGGFGVTDAAPDYFLGAGISARIPTG
jgi:hypothetical protein